MANIESVRLPDNSEYNFVDAVSGRASQPNLLINPWFTVNQRGITSGTASFQAYGTDRWRWLYGSSAGTYSLTSSGLTLTPANASDDMAIEQPLETSVNDMLNGKTITASMLLSNGTIRSGTITRSVGTSQTFFGTTSSGDTRCDINGSGLIRFRTYGNSITIRAVKLEIGSASTLYLDTVPNNAIELAECQASTADSSDTYANRGQIAMTSALTSIYATGSTNTTGATIPNGAYFYLGGAFCRAIADIATNATFTKNTNYVETTIDEEIRPKSRFDTRVDISSYSDPYGTLYSAPSDGYVSLNSGTNSSGIASTTIYSSLGISNGNFVLSLHAAKQYDGQSCFIRKGMKVVVPTLPSGFTAYFYPLY